MNRTAGTQTQAVAGSGPATRTDDPVTRQTRETFMAYAVDHDPRFYAVDATFTDMSNPASPVVGRDAIGAFLGTFYGGVFTDAEGVAENLLIEGERVMLEFTYRGTHTGRFRELAPTGLRVDLPMMSVYHVEDGLIRWARLYYDSATLWRQLGVAG